MKRKLLVVFMMVVLMLAMGACGKFSCDMCGEEKSGKSYEMEVFGEKTVMCKDCYSEIKELQDAFK